MSPLGTKQACWFPPWPVFVAFLSLTAFTGFCQDRKYDSLYEKLDESTGRKRFDIFLQLLPICPYRFTYLVL
ncbi:MAG: hypothetical protein HC859_00385 [Bacteroidia bacterium]|nr:hypothetical protein [Bacteroidia bacterium]